MYARPGTPRSIGGVLDDAIRLYRASLSSCWLLALLSGLLASATSLYTTLHLGALGLNRVNTVAGATAFMSRLQAMGSSPVEWGGDLLVALVWLVFHAAILRRQDGVAMDRPESLGGVLGFVLARLPGLVVGGIVWAITLTVGFILLVVPGVWAWGQLQLWLVALCTEDIGPFKALGRSWRLIEHHWWRATTTVGVIFIVVLVLGMSEGVFVGVAVALFHVDTVAVLMLTQLISVAVSVFTAPLLTATMLAMFYDLRLRREGGDLAARLSSLQPA